MIKKIDDFKRIDLFNQYNERDNPFLLVTTKIDVTNIVNFSKKHKNFYGTLGYLVTKTVNQIDEFKYRVKDGEIYYCDIVNSNYTQIHDDKNIGFFSVKYIENYEDYIKEFIKVQDKFNNYDIDYENGLDEIWISCFPWFKLTSIIPPIDKKITIPQFIWDKYEKENDKYYVNMLMMSHHGFTDGYHFSRFIELLNKNIDEFSKM